ncbi:MAG: hypothetical protein Q9214_007106, partial [Letrouitia sp. 1 TL-2023]
LVIDVERYPRTMVRRPITASQYVYRSDQANDSAPLSKAGLPASDVGHADSDLTNVKNIRTYQVSDERAPGGKRDIGRDDMAKGYEYGRTAVHITESDENVTKLETEAGLDIIGFVPWSKYDRFMSMSVTSIIIAQRTNSKANIALSSLIHALYELESYAIARLVSKVNRAPVIILLAPSIEIDYECLLDVQIPYAEDIRSYKFPPLDRIETVSGKVIKEHRNIPSEALQSAMDDFVDEMNLATFGEDEDGKVAEYMPITDTYSPVLHHIDQAVRWRAVHPTEHIPPPYEILTRYSNPPEQLVIQSKSRLEKLIAMADVKKGKFSLAAMIYQPLLVPPKFQGRKRHRDEIKPVSGLNVDALLGGTTKKSKVSLQNPIPDFRQILDATDTVEGIQDAVDQLGNVIEEQVKNSFGDITYGRVIEELGVVREEMVELEMPEIYNKFVIQFKRKLLNEELGGNRKDLWWEMKKNRIGLIEKRTSERSEVTEEEAKRFSNASV